MFTAHAFAALLALAAPLIARAAVEPSEPAPGEIFNTGATCHIGWDGTGDANWKGMYIQLMTGDNLNQVALTTVATNQDGSATGSFDYPCPAVIPNAAIYFYMFSSFLDPNASWTGTGRFAIASASGQTTLPTNTTQPPNADGTPGGQIPWGTGALVNASAAVPPPTAPAGSGTVAGSTPAAGSGSTATTTPVAGSSSGTTGSGSGSAPVSVNANSVSTDTAAKSTLPADANAAPSTTGSSAASAGTGKTDSAALGSAHPSVWVGVAALLLSAAAW